MPADNQIIKAKIELREAKNNDALEKARLKLNDKINMLMYMAKAINAKLFDLIN